MAYMEFDYCDGILFCKKCRKGFIGGDIRYCPYCGNEMTDIYKIKELKIISERKKP